MALENMMVDEEVVCVSGALQYTLTSGFGQDFEFEGDYDGRRDGPPPKVAAIDAIRGGGPAMMLPRAGLNRASPWCGRALGTARCSRTRPRSR